VVSRSLQGAPPTIELSLGYNQANTARALKHLLSKIEDLKSGAFGNGEPSAARG
jgi:LysR family hca operon transcriptional activator